MANHESSNPSKDEWNHLARIASEDDGRRRSVGEVVAEIRELVKARSVASKKLNSVTYSILDLLHKLSVRLCAEDSARNEWTDCSDVKLPKKRTSAKFINALVRGALGCKKQYAHKWAACIRYGIRGSVAPGSLGALIEREGGVNKVVEKYRKMIRSKKDPKTKQAKQGASKKAVVLKLKENSAVEGVREVLLKAATTGSFIPVQISGIVAPNGEFTASMVTASPSPASQSTPKRTLRRPPGKAAVVAQRTRKTGKSAPRRTG